ncbi:MAG: hypothetical protein COB02_03925 [Candidatus Cloacimonadota bacterium]|nr:MAG: hypothetical protein COB02_03925 [Candidatus Cloacimonadota bacterium]
MKKKESVLIIGSKGYLGSHLVSFLNDLEVKTYSLDINNLQDRTKLLMKSDVVILANGFSDHEAGKRDPILDYDRNIKDYLEIFRDRAFSDKKVIYLGSLCQYGKMAGEVLEDYFVSPIEPQGLNKAYIESFLELISSVKNISYTCLRLGAVIGSKLNLKNLSLLEKIILLDIKKVEIEIWGGKNRCYSYMTMNEFLLIIQYILFCNIFENQIYNCGLKNIKLLELSTLLDSMNLIETKNQPSYNINSSKLLARLNQRLTLSSLTTDVLSLKKEIVLLLEAEV